MFPIFYRLAFYWHNIWSDVNTGPVLVGSSKRGGDLDAPLRGKVLRHLTPASEKPDRRC